MKNLTLEDENHEDFADIYLADNLKDYLDNMKDLKTRGNFLSGGYIWIRDIKLEKINWRSCFAVENEIKLKMDLDLELIGYFDLFENGQKEILFSHYSQRTPKIFQIDEKSNTIKDYFLKKIKNYPKVHSPTFL